MGKKKHTAEMVIARYMDEDFFTVETNDPALASTLRGKGWKSVAQSGEYITFKLPVGAVTIRKRRVPK